MQHLVTPGDKFMLGSVFLNIQRFAKGIAYTNEPIDSTILCDVSEDVPVLSDLNQYISCYVLIDGHGSGEIAAFIQKKFIMTLFRELRRERRRNPTSINVHPFIYSSMSSVYETVDKKLVKAHGKKLESASVCCVLIVGDIIYCCTTGKSNAVLSRGGKPVELCPKDSSKPPTTLVVFLNQDQNNE